MSRITLDDVRPDQTILFDYNGGSGAGPRLVRVTEIDKSYVKGTDANKDGFRTYRRDMISFGVDLIADTHEELVFPSAFLVDATIPIEKAYAIFSMLNPEKARSSRVETKAKVIVNRRTDLPRIDVVFGNQFVRLDFFNAKGIKTGVNLKHPESAAQEKTYSCVMGDTEYNSLVANLSSPTPRTFSVAPNGQTTMQGRAPSWESKLLTAVR